MTEDGFHFPNDTASTFQHNENLVISKHKFMFICTILFINMKRAMTTMTKNSILIIAPLEGTK